MSRIAAPIDDLLGDADATEIARRLRDGEFTPLEAAGAALRRLDAVEGALCATECLLTDQLERLAGTAAGGWFAGVPSLIKDNTDIAGTPTRHGSRATPAVPVRRDGRFAEQLLRTGQLPIAKTRLPEFGFTATTEFSRARPARNPWHTDHTTGGSSGGSAALVAAGVVPIAHANDGGGSIRIPASCCGLVGLKPSRERVRVHEMADLLPINLVADGVVSRSVRDTAAFMAAAEQVWKNPALPAIGVVEHPGRQRLRIAMYTRRPDGGDCDPACRRVVERVASMCLELGHTVEEIDTPFDQQMADDFLLYWAMLAASVRWFGRAVVDRRFQPSRVEPLTRDLAVHFRSNLHRLPGAVKRLQRFRAIHADLLQRFDLLLTPTVATPPPPLGHLALDLPLDVALDRLRCFTAYTPAQNVSGAPAISLPLGRTESGLPIGVQFAAGLGRERQLLEIAFALEEAMPWPRQTSVTAGLSYPS